MDLFDFFFPEQAQAKHLRSIANSQRRGSRPNWQSQHTAEQVESLHNDVKFLTMVVVGILKRLNEVETLSLDDVKDLMSEIDALDGVADGGLETGVLRGLLGVLQADEQSSKSELDDINIVTTSRRRYR